MVLKLQLVQTQITGHAGLSAARILHPEDYEFKRESRVGPPPPPEDCHWWQAALLDSMGSRPCICRALALRRAPVVFCSGLRLLIPKWVTFSLKQVPEENQERKERFELKAEAGSVRDIELQVGEKRKI